ncbi:hypothetical protein SLA2020_348430 [Shorea laevis]
MPFFLRLQSGSHSLEDFPLATYTDDFSSRPIFVCVLAIVYPFDFLAIPRSEIRRFQLFAVLTLDSIWRARNLLFMKMCSMFRLSSLNKDLAPWIFIFRPGLKLVYPLLAPTLCWQLKRQL